MKVPTFLTVLLLVTVAARADFSCPEGTNEACLDADDTVCPVTAKCVEKDALCLDASICDSPRGYICGSMYDQVLADYEKAVGQYNQLTSENVELRAERLERKNCVINAATLKEAIKCVR